jgi:hypothetical protein
MSDDKDQPDLEHVGSDMEKVGPSFHHGRHPSRATDEYYRLSKSCPSLSSRNSLSTRIWWLSDVSTRGEKAASALESRLTDIESRIDQLLTSIEEKERDEHDSLADGPADRQSVTTSRK